MNMVRGATTIYNWQTTLFKALAHPVRLSILKLLAQEEACICHLVAGLGKRQPHVSQQGRGLRVARLVDTREDGQRVYYRLRAWWHDAPTYFLRLIYSKV